MADRIAHPRDEAAFEAAIKKPGLTVVDWFATWCPPCQRIAPKFEALAASNPRVQFIKADVDQLPDLANAHGVSAMPTFVVFKDGARVDSLVGASEEALEQLLTKN